MSRQKSHLGLTDILDEVTLAQGHHVLIDDDPRVQEHDLFLGWRQDEHGVVLSVLAGQLVLLGDTLQKI